MTSTAARLVLQRKQKTCSWSTNVVRFQPCKCLSPHHRPQERVFLGLPNGGGALKIGRRPAKLLRPFRSLARMIRAWRAAAFFVSPETDPLRLGHVN